MQTEGNNREAGLRDPFTGDRLEPKPEPGYYPGYSTLDQQGFWDAATRAVVLRRLDEPPPIRFFDSDEVRVLTVVCEHVLPQDDRPAAHRIPIVPLIDERLFEHRTRGYRFENMPPHGEAYRLAIQIFQVMARELHGREFLELSWREQDELLKTIRDGKPTAALHLWQRLPVHRFWTLLIEDCVEVYYAHPWSWDEIGYGGPAYPRGYFRLERGEPEPWEVEEKRYFWQAPPDTVSDLAELEKIEDLAHLQQGDIHH